MERTFKATDMKMRAQSSKQFEGCVPFSTLAVFASALAVWAVFYPAIMSVDSVNQYHQAVSGKYNDWHPPIMAILLSLVMKFGGDIGVLMFVQCLVGCFGVRDLALRVLYNPRAYKQASGYIAVVILLFLLSPLSPLAFYLMTFWKDSWVAIAFVWICSISIQLYGSACYISRHRFFFFYFLLTILMALAMLARYNAILVFPSFCLVLYLILRQRASNQSVAFLLVLFPSILYGTVNLCQNILLNIEHHHPEQQIMALDLVGMIVNDPSLRNDLPYTSQHLEEDYRARYRRGSIAPLYWESPLIVDESYTANVKNERLAREYQRAIVRFPFSWTKVKIQAFYELIRPTITYYWFHKGITTNQFGLVQNQNFEQIRNIFSDVAQKVGGNFWLRWFSGVHLVWIIVNILGILFYLASYFRCRDAYFVFWAALLSIPFAYYGSYLLAVTVWDFRFMYPATLTLQTITIAHTASTAISIVQSRLLNKQDMRVDDKSKA